MGTEPGASPKLDLILMPAVAFDRNRHRLGHGMGFYDRYLQSYRAAVDKSSGRMPSLGEFVQYLMSSQGLIVDDF